MQMKNGPVPKGRLKSSALPKTFRPAKNPPMSYIASYFHCIFATKDRRPVINPDLQQRLYPYIGGIARENQLKLIEIGGIADHVHLLLSLPSTMPISKALQLIKGGSSKWIHDTFPEHRLFQWQEKYGAFSVSVSQLEAATNYIRTQEEHHRNRTFEEEFAAFLKTHRIEYDPKYLWK
jgi:putative transposase